MYNVFSSISSDIEKSYNIRSFVKSIKSVLDLTAIDIVILNEAYNGNTYSSKIASKLGLDNSMPYRSISKLEGLGLVIRTKYKKSKNTLNITDKGRKIMYEIESIYIDVIKEQ